MEIFRSWDGCVNEAGIATLRCVPIVFQNVVTAALLFAGVTALFFIIFSGYKFMVSNGDPKKIEESRKTAIYAIIGLVLILLSFSIVQFISITTGVTCFNAFDFDSCDTAKSNPNNVQKNTDIGETSGRSSQGMKQGDQGQNKKNKSTKRGKSGGKNKGKKSG